ncbi:MAG: hypothetical protein QXH58_00085 [Nitrososphaerales archaeon]
MSESKRFKVSEEELTSAKLTVSEEELTSIKEVAILDHSTLKKAISELGEVLNFIPKQEYTDPHGLYRFDVVWLEDEGLPPVKVFEVQVKGQTDLALTKLQHARDVWRGSDLFIVITEERDFERAKRIIEPHLRGAFHRLKGLLMVLTADKIAHLHSFLMDYKELLHKLTKRD